MIALSSQLLAQDIVNPVLDNISDLSPSQYFSGLIPLIVSLIIVVGIIVFLVFLLMGGVAWITSGGDKMKLEQARKRLTTALVGLIILLSFIAILRLFETFFGIGFGEIHVGPYYIGTEPMPTVPPATPGPTSPPATPEPTLPPGVTATPTPISTICSILYGRLENAYGSGCGDPDYDPVADLNKDGFVNLQDFALIAYDRYNDVKCQAWLDDTFDPCATFSPICLDLLERIMDISTAFMSPFCGEAGYDPIADVNKDGRVDITDGTYVSGRLWSDSECRAFLDDTTNPCDNCINFFDSPPCLGACQICTYYVTGYGEIEICYDEGELCPPNVPI